MDTVTVAAVSAEIKAKAGEDMFGPATAIVEAAVASHVGTKPVPNLAKTCNLAAPQMGHDNRCGLPIQQI